MVYMEFQPSLFLFLNSLVCFFFNDTATTEIYTLSLHDALPIWPRRVWWSCLCSLRCSVRWLMRWLSSAICTSGEPVSPSVVAYSAMILFLVSASVPTDMRAPSVLSSARRAGACSPGHSRSAADARRVQQCVVPSRATDEEYQRGSGSPKSADERR